MGCQGISGTCVRLHRGARLGIGEAQIRCALYDCVGRGFVTHFIPRAMMTANPLQPLKAPSADLDFKPEHDMLLVGT